MIELREYVISLAKKARVAAWTDLDIESATRERLKSIIELLLKKINLDEQIGRVKKIVRNEVNSCSIEMIQANAQYTRNKADLKRLIKRIDAISNTVVDYTGVFPNLKKQVYSSSLVSTTKISKSKSKTRLTRQ